MSDHLPKMRHHPRIGYTFIPLLKKFITGQGASYLLRTNSDGFRSEVEFERRPHPQGRRALVFGDSQTAGEGVSNRKRFTDLIEARPGSPQLYNLALTGTGTDQQLMAYREFAPLLPHDLLVLCVYVENVTRIHQKVLRWPDPDGQWNYYGKPYFELTGGQLELHGVPVPERPWNDETLPAALRLTDEPVTVAQAAAEPGGLRGLVRRHVSAETRRRMVPVLRRFVRRKGLPAYESAHTPHWQLMRGILRQWIAESRVPVLVVPLPAVHFLFEPNDAGPCLARFRELAKETGCRLFDPLPGLWNLSPEQRHACWNYENSHLSEAGHQQLATLLAPVIDAMLQPEPARTQQPAPLGAVTATAAG